MNEPHNTSSLNIRTVFLIVGVVFVFFYLRWFRLTPFVYLDDPSFAFLGGCLLMLLCGISAVTFSPAKTNIILKPILLLVTVALFGINVLYLNLYMPRIGTTAKCNGNTYYITYAHPLFDGQWTYRQLSIWRGFFSYESFFFGYAPGWGSSEIICDETNNETNVVSTFTKALVYTDGDNPRVYEEYVAAQLGNKRYFLSRNLFLPEGDSLERHHPAYNIYTYQLYGCNIDYTNCTSLPIEYTTDEVGFFALEADELKNEINLYDEYDSSEKKILIFTYGKNPRCYVDGCTMLKE